MGCEISANKFPKEEYELMLKEENFDIWKKNRMEFAYVIKYENMIIPALLHINHRFRSEKITIFGYKYKSSIVEIFFEGSTEYENFRDIINKIYDSRIPKKDFCVFSEKYYCDSPMIIFLSIM